MAANSTTILVVDDEQLVRENLAAYLEDEGYTVVMAASGEEALDMVSAGGIALAIVDMRLPGIDGNAVILRAHVIDPEITFIIHTGSSSYLLPDELVEIGIEGDQVVRKPVGDMAQFLEKIAERIGSKPPMGH